MATDPVGGVQLGLVGHTKEGRTEEVFGGWTGFCRSAEQRIIPSDKKVSDTRTTSCSESSRVLCVCSSARCHFRTTQRILQTIPSAPATTRSLGLEAATPNAQLLHGRVSGYLAKYIPPAHSLSDPFCCLSLLEAVSRGACFDCSGPRPGGNQYCLICFGPLFFCLPQFHVEVRAGTSFVSLYFSSASRL